MNSIEYSIGGGLALEQLRRLHETALRVLDEIGVEIVNPTLLEQIGGHSGVRVDGTRVRFAAELVNRMVDAHRAAQSPAPAPGNEFFTDVLDGYCFQVLDPDTDRLRLMNTTDCVRLARLVGGLHGQGVRGGNPGLPQDVPAILREILAYKISLEQCPAPGWPGFTSPATAEVVLRMAQTAGRSIGISVFILNPLLVEGSTVDMAVDFLMQGRKVSMGLNCMPLLGATTPIRLPGAFVESLATVLGAFTAFMLLGADLGIGTWLFPFDMRYGTIAYGTPEHIVAWLMGNQLSAFYNNGNGSWFCPAFHSSAMAPDAHSMLTRSAFAAVGALNGARHFGFAGWVGLDKFFSPEQLILDIEIVRYIRHLVKSVEFTDEALGLNALREVGPRGNFLTHPDTLAHCREQWASPIFKNQSPEQWMGRRAPGLKEQIREIIREAEAANNWTLSPDVGRELDRIYQHAARTLV